MRKTGLFVVIAALAASSPSIAQQAELPLSPLGPQSSVLTVIAQGESRRAPDLALFEAGVVTQGQTASEATTANARKMQAVLAALKKAGVADRDIQTSSLSLQPRFSDPERETNRQAQAAGTRYIPPAQPAQPEIIGYEARNNVRVRVRDVARMGRIVDTLVDAGANQVNGPSFTLDDQDAALDEARVDAMEAAQGRAELYAKAAGLRVVRILSISEGSGYYGPVAAYDIQVTARGGGMAAPPPPSPVAPGELSLTASVTVQYELSR